MSMEYREILELWEKFETSDVVEMSLDFHGTHFYLKKGDSSAAELYDTEETAKPLSVEKSGLKAGFGYRNPEDLSAKFRKASEVQPSLKEILAPLAGIFYRAPSPDAPPFVEIGQTVKKGDVVGIIEAMKLMNEIMAEEDGVITEIPAEDASFVGYEDPLFLLK